MCVSVESTCRNAFSNGGYRSVYATDECVQTAQNSILLVAAESAVLASCCFTEWNRYDFESAVLNHSQVAVLRAEVCGNFHCVNRIEPIGFGEVV